MTVLMLGRMLTSHERQADRLVDEREYEPRSSCRVRVAG